MGKTAGAEDGIAGGVGVIFLTGAAPPTVYTGAEEDPLLTRMSSGGSVYWIGPTIGRYVAWPDGGVTEVEDWEGLFYGSGMLCVVGGPYDDYTRTDLVQVVASGATYCSGIVWMEVVDVRGGSVSGQLPDVDGSYVYIFCGGYYSPYGQRYVLCR